jgi:hypothetical protein
MLFFDEVILCPEPITIKMETEANLKMRTFPNFIKSSHLEALTNMVNFVCKSIGGEGKTWLRLVKVSYGDLYHFKTLICTDE